MICAQVVLNVWYPLKPVEHSPLVLLMTENRQTTKFSGAWKALVPEESKANTSNPFGPSPRLMKNAWDAREVYSFPGAPPVYNPPRNDLLCDMVVSISICP